MTATYTKMRDGSWGLRVIGGVPAVGAAVTAEKRSGERKTETVAAVVWSGEQDGAQVALCSIVPTTRTRTVQGFRGANPYQRQERFGPPCGYPGCTGGRTHCDECS